MRIDITLKQQFIEMKQDQKDYVNQNQQLKQLHLLRMARKVQKTKEQAEINPQQLKKVINPIQQQSPKNQTINQIYLNAVFYDSRLRQEKYNNIMLPCLLHPDVQALPLKPISQDVEAILITNYGFEMEVFQPIVKYNVPFFVFNRMDNKAEGEVIKEYEGFKNMTVISPPKRNTGYGVFHTKLWLIKFKKFLRVVVSTSNNHVLDWSIWQNSYWYHDCPLLGEENSKKGKEIKQKAVKESGQESRKQFPFEADFIETLNWILTEMQPKGYNVLKQMKIDSLDRYSFKGVKAVLIPSLVGRFKGNYLDKVGLGKVKKIMKNYVPELKNPTLTANCTSLGRLDQKFIRQVYTSFCPSSGLFNLNRVKLVYPTDKYIKERTCGESQVLFLKPENYAKSDIKNQVFYKYQPSVFNGVQGGIPHLKTIILQQQESKRVILYMGSHNLTQAAWGSFEKNGSQISCNNQELGLLFLDYTEEQLLRWLPYQFPPEKYSQNDKPFIQ